MTTRLQALLLGVVVLGFSYGEPCDDPGGSFRGHAVVLVAAGVAVVLGRRGGD